MGTTRMPAPIRPKKANGKEQNVYWIRKKVPKRYRALVGKTEVWRSLKTTDRRTANARIAVASEELEREWKRLAIEAKQGPKGRAAGARLAHQDLFAIQRETHVRLRDAHIAEPGTGLSALRWHALAAEPADVDDEEALDRWAREILTREGGGPPTDVQVDKFKPLLVEAKKGAYGDIARASKAEGIQARGNAMRQDRQQFRGDDLPRHRRHPFQVNLNRP